MGDVNARVTFVDISTLDAESQHLIEIADENGAPNSNLVRVLGHRPDILKGFFHIWKAAFEGGAIAHSLKELVRVKIAVMFECGY
jgi:alkylhydroperoxidase family enzyme